MRNGTSSRRHRNRNNNNGRRGNNNQQRTQVYDSNGPDVRIRGTAHQVAEKYLALAKDATSSGDRIVAQNYYQHAEHYIRIINELNGSFESSKPASGNKAEGNNNEVKSQEAASKAKPAVKEEGLGLPASILGPEVAVEEKSEEVVD